MDLIDPSTGTKLTPSYHGKECLGNGSWPGYECCCDECDYYLNCFPEANDPELKYHYGDSRDFWRPVIREETCLACKHRESGAERKFQFRCNITKREGRELRGLRCPYFEKDMNTEH